MTSSSHTDGSRYLAESSEIVTNGGTVMVDVQGNPAFYDEKKLVNGFPVKRRYMKRAPTAERVKSSDSDRENRTDDYHKYGTKDPELQDAFREAEGTGARSTKKTATSLPTVVTPHQEPPVVNFLNDSGHETYADASQYEGQYESSSPAHNTRSKTRTRRSNNPVTSTQAAARDTCTTG